MQKIYFSMLLAGIVFLCGCDKQTKINTAKIDALSQKLVLVQQLQSKQLSDIQSQLTALAPTMDKINGTYFEKNHEDAFFFHTNTLYLLLLVERRIEAELQTAAAERQKDQSLANTYYTNQIAMTALSADQVTNAIAEQASQLGASINGETKRLMATLAEDLVRQMKAFAPDAADQARQKQLAVEVSQIKNELAQLRLQLGATNRP